MGSSHVVQPHTAWNRHVLLRLCFDAFNEPRDNMCKLIGLIGMASFDLQQACMATAACCSTKGI